MRPNHDRRIGGPLQPAEKIGRFEPFDRLLGKIAALAPRFLKQVPQRWLARGVLARVGAKPRLDHRGAQRNRRAGRLRKACTGEGRQRKKQRNGPRGVHSLVIVAEAFMARSTVNSVTTERLETSRRTGTDKNRLLRLHVGIYTYVGILVLPVNWKDWREIRRELVNP